MKTTQKLFLLVAVLSVPAVSYVSSLHSSYYAGAFESSPLKDGPRMSNRCNLNSDCPAGEECSAFGMCEPS